MRAFRRVRRFDQPRHVMQLETLSAPLEIKLASNTETGEFEGYGSFFGNVDRVGDVMQAGAFAATLAERKAAGLPLPPMHFNHGLPEMGGERGVGVWKEMAEDSRGLRVKGRLSGMNTDRGRYLFERVRDGAIGGISIGFSIRPNGAEYSRGGAARRTLKAINLAEVSIVDEPANTLARVESVKLAGIGDLESLLRRGGLSKAAARLVAAGGWPALSDEPEPDMAELKALEAAAAAELSRALDHNLTELKGLIR